jgi:hypothetical protein
MLDETYYLDGGGIHYNLANLGNYPNDCFDDQLYNAGMQAMKMGEDGKWVYWVHIFALKRIDDGEEIFIRYGKAYWCYLPNYNSLPKDQQEKCRAYYAIEEADFQDDYVELPQSQLATVKKSTGKKSNK